MIIYTYPYINILNLRYMRMNIKVWQAFFRMKDGYSTKFLMNPKSTTYLNVKMKPQKYASFYTFVSFALLYKTD